MILGIGNGYGVNKYSGYFYEFWIDGSGLDQSLDLNVYPSAAVFRGKGHCSGVNGANLPFHGDVSVFVGACSS